MSVSENAIVTTLEELLDSLSGHTPDSLHALTLVESILQQEPCAEELQAAGESAAELVQELLLPLLTKDNAKLEKVKVLQASWCSATFAHDQRTPEKRAEQEAILEEMKGWVVDNAVPDPTSKTSPTNQAEETPLGLPRALFDRLTTALQLMGESEASLQTSINRWQDAKERPWKEVETVLHQINTAGHKAADAPWLRQKRMLYDALLLPIADTCEVAIGHLGRRRAETSQLLEELRQPGNQPNTHRLHGLLHTQVTTLHKEASSLKRQQDESRIKAEQLKDRLDQLGEALTQARTEHFQDPVTGIPDRFAFTAHLKRHLERAVHLGEVFALLLFHIHDFQHLIETLDGTAGAHQGSVGGRLVEALLKEIGQHVPEEAFLARLSVERFVILLPKCTEEEGKVVGTTIGNALENNKFSIDGQEHVISAYFGCAAYQPGMNAVKMLEITDRLAASAHAEKHTPRKEAQQVRTG